jgi:DNA polymerase-3 subunit epsilon
MFKNLVLQKPLALIDLETTGTDPQKDRIVEIAILIFCPNGRPTRHVERLHPGMPIPPAATAIHGITDKHVADKPRFKEVAGKLLALLADCDFCGFNLKKFDLRMLYAEFARAGKSLPLENRAIVDPLEIFFAYEKRDLAAAVRFYCGRDHEDAHSAAADVQATAEVLDAMLGRYGDLPRTVAGLHQQFKDPNALDANGSFVRVNGEVQFAFGKYRGQSLRAVAREKPDYLQWMLTQDFFDDAKALVRQALAKR